MKTIVLATKNKNKLQELSLALNSFETIFKQKIKWQSMMDYSILSPEETGLSFVENAILKARHTAKITKTAVLADDSGIAIPILNNQPGIYSARYAGENSSDQQNNEKLLNNLQGKDNVTAFFYCSLVYIKHAEDPTPLISEGYWYGKITNHLTGENGFGYDSVFYIPELQCTAAQLSKEKKLQHSHRGKAIKELLIKAEISQNFIV